MSQIDIRLARSDEAPAISALVLEVFEAMVAPYYAPRAAPPSTTKPRPRQWPRA